MKSFRPENLKDVVGCDDIKETINMSIVASHVKNDAFPHTLLYGGPGLGKTTIANIIANERGGDFKVFLANVFKSRADVQRLMATLNHEGYEDTPKGEEPDHPAGFRIVDQIKPTVIFLDEIHQLRRPVQECLFQAMEDNIFTVESKNVNSGVGQKQTFWVPKFTLIGATTRAGDLDQPFVDRFKLQFTLKLYTIEELSIMIVQCASSYGISITGQAVEEIAKRSRGVARKAINFLERARDTAIYLGVDKVDTKVAREAFKLLHIDGKGLDDIDLQALSYLYKISPRKIGIARLASVLNVTENVLKEIVEPYLLREGLMEATPGGRIITEEGQEYCEKNNLVPAPPASAGYRRRVGNV